MRRDPDRPDADDDTRVGLCTRCRFARAQESAKGSVFWRCLRADEDPRFRRYPPLPVLACSGFDPRDEPTRPS